MYQLNIITHTLKKKKEKYYAQCFPDVAEILLLALHFMARKRPGLWTCVLWLTWKLRHFSLHQVQFLKWSIKYLSYALHLWHTTLRLLVVSWASLMKFLKSSTRFCSSSIFMSHKGVGTWWVSHKKLFNKWVSVYSKFERTGEIKQIGDLGKVGKMSSGNA